MQMKSNEICFCCIRRNFEKTISCEHVICEICVRNFDDKISIFEFQYQIDVCMFCHTKKLLIKLRSFIVELRLLNINDERTFEIITIKFINVLQNILESIWRIQNLFDVIYDISVDLFNDSTFDSLIWLT